MQKRRFFCSVLLAGGLFVGSMTYPGVGAEAASIGTEIADRADDYLGREITNFDSADFVSYVLEQNGIQVSSNLHTLSQGGEYISDKNNLQQGDILFFGTSKSNLLAAGIYLGNNEFVVAYKPYGTIKKMDMQSDVAQKYYLGAKRYANTHADVTNKAPTENDPDNGNQTPSNESAIRQSIIEAGKKYLGTPYKYGSSRSDKSTMDCSEFVRWAYYEGANIVLPSNSRSQGKYVMENGTYTTDWKKLKPGDLMFFMDYRGWQLSNYSGIDKSSQRISHVAIYLGDGKILHTYSNEAGGVTISTFEGKHWEARFMFGGSVLGK